MSGRSSEGHLIRRLGDDSRKRWFNGLIRECRNQVVESIHAIMIPLGVTLEQLMGIVDNVAEAGTAGVTAAHLREHAGAGVDTMSVIAFAERLGLAKSQNARVSVTEFGLKLHEASNFKNKARFLKEIISTAEPCSTAIAILSTRKATSAKEIAVQLRRRGIEWSPDNDANESAIKGLLVDWAVEAELLRSNRKGDFTVFATGPTQESNIRARRRAKVQAYRILRKSRAEANKKFRDARRAAWTEYREKVKAAKKARDEALVAALAAATGKG